MTTVVSSGSSMARLSDHGSDCSDYPAVDAFSAEAWRLKYIEEAEMLADARNELDELQRTSKEIEDELEMELVRTEKVHQDLKEKVAKVEAERDDWKLKFMGLQATHNTTTTSLQRELDSLRNATKEFKAQVRELEMGNDDLERTERVVKSSLAEMEDKYNRAIEEKTLLEHELLSRGALEEECQRLRDELRDSNLEVAIMKDKEVDLRRQLETRSSLGPSPLTSPSEVDEHDLQLEDLTVKPAEPIRRPSLDSRIPTATPPPSTNLAASTGLTRTVNLANLPPSPSRIPARRSVASSSVSSPSTHPRLGASRNVPSTPAAAPQKSKGQQMVSEMRARVRSLELRIHKGPRPRGASTTLARVKEASSTSEREGGADTSPAGSSSWVIVSDSSSGPDSSYAIVNPPTPLPPRTNSSLSRSSAAEMHRPNVDRRRSMEVQSPPPGAFAHHRLIERDRALSASVAPVRRPSSRLANLAASASPFGGEVHQFPARPQTPTFIPVPVSHKLSQSVAAPSSSRPLRRSTLLGPNNPPQAPSARSNAHSTRPISLPPPPVPPLPKGIAPASNVSSLPSASGSIPVPSRLGRPNSIGVSRRPAAPGPKYAAAPQDDEEEVAEMGLASGGGGKEGMQALGIGRARARARASSGGAGR